MNLYDYLLSTVQENKIALIHNHEQVSYATLVSFAENIAATLTELGLQKGKSVGILAENSLFWVASYLGILKIGAVVIPLPLRLNIDKMMEYILLTQCDLICIDTTFLKKYLTHIPTHIKLLTLKQHENHMSFSENVYGFDSTDKLMTSSVDVNENKDLAALMLTSGSTGTPNAVRISHRNVMANTDSIIDYLSLSGDDRMMVVLPFDYCFGTSLLHTHLRVGGSLVINNSFHFIDEILNEMQLFSCTGFAGVPAVYQHLLRKSSFYKRSFPKLKHVQQAGGALSEGFIREFITAFPAVRFYVMYGQTEATARLSYLPPDRLHDKMGSIGRGLKGVKLQILDDDGVPVPPGVEGELVAEGENVALGYLVSESELQENRFRNGQLFTGDLGYVDDDGFIFITGRKSDFLKISGYRVSCQEIENVLSRIDGVVEVAVIGIPNSDFGEVPKAYIVTQNGEPIPINIILAFCKKRLKDYAIPKQYTFVPELPKNSAHKIIKRLLV